LGRVELSEKPTAAFVVSLIAGIFILLGAIVMMALSSMLGGLALGVGAGAAAGIVLIYGVVGLIFAILVLVGAVMLWMKPQSHVAAGVIILLFSLFSIISTGGFFIGLILGIVGGILAIVWKPPAPMAPGMMQPMPRACPLSRYAISGRNDGGAESPAVPSFSGSRNDTPRVFLTI